MGTAVTEAPPNRAVAVAGTMPDNGRQEAEPRNPEMRSPPEAARSHECRRTRKQPLVK